MDNKQYINPAYVEVLIRERRTSQRAIALAIGITPPTFSRWMLQQSAPDPDNLTKLAEYLEVKDK